MAHSKDLINWNKSEYNPVIVDHLGWRSKTNCTEPNHIELREDTIILMIAGVKKFNTQQLNSCATDDRYKGKSGNVDDAQLGLYISTDNGQNYTPHPNNPIFVNDYSNEYENEHMGGNFEYIETDSISYIFYQAKNTRNESKYSIMLRTKDRYTPR